MNKRILNLVLCVVFLFLLIALPILNLLFTEVTDNTRGDAFAFASYVMLFLFGSLTLVFGLRAIKGGSAKVV